MFTGPGSDPESVTLSGKVLTPTPGIQYNLFWEIAGYKNGKSTYHRRSGVLQPVIIQVFQASLRNTGILLTGLAISRMPTVLM
jgi:hypothetical protein